MGLRNMRGSWQYRFFVHSHSVCVSTGLAATERNRQKAEQQEATHRQEILAGRWGYRALKPRAFDEALPEFIAWSKVEYGEKPGSWRRIATSMASCSVFFGKRMVSMIAPGDIERYKIWRLSPREETWDGKRLTIPPVRPVTAKHDLDNLSVFFQWAVKADYARHNPLKEVGRPSDRDAVRQRIVSLKEEKLYFAHATGNLVKVARLMLLTGMRPEEVMRIRKDDVDLEKDTLRIEYGKTRSARRVLKLTEEARSLLARQIVESYGPWVFPSPTKPGAHIVKLNGSHDRVLDKLNPCRQCGQRETQHPTKKCPEFILPDPPLLFVLYDLRHTFATRMVEAGVDLVTLKQILGHSDIRVTMRYVHPTQAHQDAAMTMYDKLNEQRRAAAETLQ